MVRGIFEGAALICRYASADLIRMTGIDPTGVPASEAWVDDRGSQQLMARVQRTGVPDRMVVNSSEGRLGTLVVVPVLRSGAVWGVATEWRPAPVPIPPRRGIGRPPRHRAREQAVQ